MVYHSPIVSNKQGGKMHKNRKEIVNAGVGN